MRALGLHHVRFGATDLDETVRFATDFGLKLVSRDERRAIMRTSGGDAYSYIVEPADSRRFLGIAFEVAGTVDLEEAVARHGATPIRDLDTPGGGQGVTLTDPEGLRVELVANIGGEDAHLPHSPLTLNIPGNRGRVNAAQGTREMRSAHLFRLGHVGLYVRDFARTAAWYGDVLGMIASDTIHDGDPERKIVGFLRLDRGDELVDHHTLFLAQFGKSDCHHISFEVQDFEAQFIAHRFLAKQGWKPNWGVGRHPLGSHVFDVWFDPDGYRFETFSDTDVVNGDRPAGNHDVHEQQMDLWSSDSPERYFA